MPTGGGRSSQIAAKIGNAHIGLHVAFDPFMNLRHVSVACLMAALPAAVACSDGATAATGADESNLTAAMTSELKARTADGVLDGADVNAILQKAGNRVDWEEMITVRDGLAATTYRVEPEAVRVATEFALTRTLFDGEKRVVLGQASRSYGGSAIPAKVRELLVKARLSGAETFDIREQDPNATPDEHDNGGVWSPYPSTAPPIGNMTFVHTEVTPAKLLADLADKLVTYNSITGTGTKNVCDGANNCQDVSTVTYTKRTGGTGNVLAHFDEAGLHEDLMARGEEGQIWANNCAILSDGSLHCIPAARRSVLEDVILTNPHLSRCSPLADQANLSPEMRTLLADSCKHLMYMGHVDIRAGVVVGVEISGRLSKRIVRGKNLLIDPVAVLEAWGFQISPNLRIVFGNTEEGVPVQDRANGVLMPPAGKTP